MLLDCSTRRSISNEAIGALAVMLMAPLLLACIPGVSTDEVSRSPGSSFYAWDGSIPEPGTLLREEGLEPELSLSQAAEAYRILYASENHRGEPAVVSGAVFVPPGPAPADGWPVLAWSHGTVGSADVCAPSRNPRKERDATYLNHWLSAGYAVVATDYEGLGTDGAHPYLHCASEAYGNIDGVRAARGLGISLARQWLVLGQSQGGQGALCTGAYATPRAPELDFRGTLATAPGVNFLDVFSSGEPDQPMPFLGFVLLLVAGMDEYTEEFSAAATLSPAASAMLPRTEEICGPRLNAEGAALGLTNATAFRVPLSEAKGIPEAAAKMEVPLTGWDRPVYIAQGTEDRLLPYQGAIDFTSSLCEAGADVTLRIFEGAGHSGPMREGLGEFTEWVAARFADEPNVDSCP